MLSQIANPKSDFNKVNMTSSEKMYPFKQKKSSRTFKSYTQMHTRHIHIALIKTLLLTEIC